MKILLPTLLAVLIETHFAAAEKAIDREVIVNAPVQKVWQAWTTTEGIKTFFCAGRTC